MRSLMFALACVSSLFFAPVAVAEARVALVIGNSEYDLASWRLPNPVNDAAAVSGKLEGMGFQVTTLLDADEDAMEDAVSDFRRTLREAGEDAVGLFYFSGHGVQADGRNWLMPVDFDGNTLDDVIGDSLRLGDVLSAMERAGNAMNFVILDACRNDPLPRATRDAGRGLAPEARQSGMVIAYAAAPGQAALDGVGGDLSPFTAAFVDLVDGPYHAGELFPLISGKVRTATDGRQQPWVEIGVSANSADDFFYFNPDALLSGPSIVEVLSEELADLVALNPIVLDVVRRSDGGLGLFQLAQERIRVPGGQDDDQAARLADASCRRGFADGCNLLAGIYSEAWGVEQDHAKAFELFQQACAEGSTIACGNIGVMYRDGRGVAQSYEQALPYMAEACQKQDAVQCNNLGEMLLAGQGTFVDEEAAAAAFYTSCSRNESLGCLNYAQMQLDGRGGIEQNRFAAMDLLRRVCQSANPAMRQEVETACGPLLQESRAQCDRDDLDACRDLAILRIEGRGLEQDVYAGLNELEDVCRREHVPSCITLVQAYFQGRVTPQDRDKAIFFARRAYDLGDRVTAAQYLRELGVEP